MLPDVLCEGPGYWIGHEVMSDFGFSRMGYVASASLMQPLQANALCRSCMLLSK